MTIALGAVALSLLLLAWCVWHHAGVVEEHARQLETHAAQLAAFGRAVYGLGGGAEALTTADAEAAQKLAGSEQARKSGPG